METKVNFDLIAPDHKVFSGLVDQVVLPGIKGQIGILPRHAPFMSTMKQGIVTVFNAEKKEYYFITGGLADVSPEGLIVLAEQVWLPEEKKQKEDAHLQLQRQLKHTEEENERAYLAQKIQEIETYLQAIASLH